MKKALLEAEKAKNLGEVPVGAVAVIDGEIIASAHNLVEEEGVATRHAEMLCIERAAKILGDWRLSEVTLYTTLEPCAMCFGAIMLARIKKVVYGAPDLRHGACGSWVNLLEKKHPTHTLDVEGGVLEEEAASLMQNFFQKRRHENGIRRANRLAESKTS